MIKSASLVLALFLIIGCADQENSIDSYIGFDIPKSELDAHLQQQMAELNIPGMSIAFINDNKIVYYKTYGYADVENKIPVSSETIFEGASISKSVFATFVMSFVEEGKLDLDKPLYKYLPYSDIAHDERYKKITARIVLSHRSGFPNWREDEPDNLLKLKFDPGENYLYSGEGYQYLALVLKHIENTNWEGLEDLFQKKIAQPLKMEHTVFIQTPYSRYQKAQPYDENGKWIDWKNDYWHNKSDTIFVAAATIHSEPKDFSKWMKAVMNQEILTSESYMEILKPHSTIEESSAYNTLYTLGFVHLDMPFTNLYFHGGNNQGFTSWYALDTHKKWGYVLFTNSEKGEQLGGDLLFYLFAGPNKTKLYFLLGTVILITFYILWRVFKAIFRRIRKKR